MPNYQRRIVYLSDEQCQTLFTNGSVTVDGVTVEYSASDMYVTPQSNPVTDVKINNASATSNGVANIPIASPTAPGVAIVRDSSDGLKVDSSNRLILVASSAGMVKAGTSAGRAITPSIQDAAAFYGLAKAAGDSTQASSDNAVGTYTAGAKTAIKTMLGVTDPTVSDVQVNSTSIINNGVANVPVADDSTFGVVKTSPTYGTGMRTDGTIQVCPASDAQIKGGTGERRPVAPFQQHQAVFYGLAKAAGDSTQSASSNFVGTYTADAKAAIKIMLGVTDLPTVSSSDNDKVLKVVSGAWAAATAPSGLPTVTSADNGKVLMVVNGAWAAVSLSQANGVNF